MRERARPVWRPAFRGSCAGARRAAEGPRVASVRRGADAAPGSPSFGAGGGSSARCSARRRTVGPACGWSPLGRRTRVRSCGGTRAGTVQPSPLRWTRPAATVVTEARDRLMVPPPPGPPQHRFRIRRHVPPQPPEKATNLGDGQRDQRRLPQRRHRLLPRRLARRRHRLLRQHHRVARRLLRHHRDRRRLARFVRLRVFFFPPGAATSDAARWTVRKACAQSARVM